MAQTKFSKAQLTKFAALDKRDSENAFEIGFAKAATDLGLSEKEFDQFYRIGVERLQAQAAAGK